MGTGQLHSNRHGIFSRCHADCCVMVCSEKALKLGLGWLSDLSAVYHYTKFGIASLFMTRPHISYAWL